MRPVCLARRRHNSILAQDDSIVVLRITQGQITIIDRAMYDKVKDHCWHASKSKNTYYVVSDIYDGHQWRGVRLHQLLMNAPRGQFVDHINGNGLDNRLCNLRICNNNQNIRNSPRRADNTSGYKGVHQRPHGKWQARIVIDGKRKSLGHFDDPVSAAHAYDAAARKYYGEFARPNFT